MAAVCPPGKVRNPLTERCGAPPAKVYVPLTQAQVFAQLPNVSLSDIAGTREDVEGVEDVGHYIDSVADTVCKNPKKFLGPRVKTLTPALLEKLAWNKKRVTLVIAELTGHSDYVAEDAEVVYEREFRLYGVELLTVKRDRERIIELLMGQEDMSHEQAVRWLSESGTKFVMYDGPFGERIEELGDAMALGFGPKADPPYVYTWVRDPRDTRAATTIQAAWRGHRSREVYAQKMHEHYAPGGVGATAAIQRLYAAAAASPPRRRAASPPRRRAASPPRRRANKAGRNNARQ